MPTLNGQQQQQDDDDKVKKLPPVNYFRSREVDVKNVSIDLKLKFEKTSPDSKV